MRAVVQRVTRAEVRADGEVTGAIGPGLAESWTISPDGTVYTFKLRADAAWSNGDPVTAEDVKFSFERYRGANATTFKERVQEVRVLDPRRIQFHLREPWLDFITFYGTHLPCSATAQHLCVKPARRIVGLPTPQCPHQ